MGSNNKAKKLKDKSEVKKSAEMGKKEAKDQVGIMKRLKETQPEFFEYLKDNDEELLDFDEEDLEDNLDTDAEEEEFDDDDDVAAEPSDAEAAMEEEPSRNVITSAMVDSWIDAVQSDSKLAAVRSLLKAFRSACHYGDDSGDDPAGKFSTMSSGVFNKIMLFVLNEMDGILREILQFPSFGGKAEMVKDLMATKRWKKYNLLVKSYLGNSLHILNQMTDNEMIAFLLRRLKYSSIFLAAFPALLRRYTKVALHFWGTGNGVLPVVSFLFLRDCCVRLGSDCLDECIKGMYKAYVLNCHFVNSTKLQHIQFLANCFTELLRVDIPAAYQHAFVYMRQLVMILKEALSSPTKKKKTGGKGKDEAPKKQKGKEAHSGSSKKEIFRKVYQWKFINCLELWTGVVCAYSTEAELRPLAYPLTQIITGVARLVPSACYFPLRLRCVRMLNRISESTGSFIPVSLLLLDSLEYKELRKPPTGGVGKAVDLHSILKVSKSTLKTRAFQEGCIFSVVEELTEHLAQWSYSIAFMELSFIPCVRLRNFSKSTKVDRFRKEIRRLTREVEANSDFVNKKRTTVTLLPNDPEAESFLEDEKKSGTSPLSQYVAILRQRAQERRGTFTESSVLIGDRTSKFGKISSDDEYDDSENEEKADLLLSDHFSKQQKNVEKKNTPLKIKHTEVRAINEDVVEDLVLSSDEDTTMSDGLEGDDDDDESEDPQERSSKKRKHVTDMHKKGKDKAGNKKSKKRKHGR